MPIKRQEALTLSDLLGSLLGSVVEAQAQSARATVEFVESVGFEETEDGPQLRTVTLRYTKKDENGDDAEFEVEVPLLALVNVPSLAVSEARLAFSYDVVSQSATSGTGTAALDAAPAESATSPALISSTAAVLTGFIRTKPTPQPDTSSNVRRTTSIDLEVKLEQQEIPIGIERLFDLAELGISERPVARTSDDENG
jgi:hypothetical protein